ncbi:MAG: hypothetical protein NT147_03420 [Candidatus Aminicenantes bacterium]|nr:hypothetical protein [Candidatus Aminicenantes bacterium]
MKAIKRLGTAGLVLLSTVALTVALSGETGPEPVTGSASLGTFNRYIFRGYRLGRDSLVFEPALSASTGGFSVAFWGNIDMREEATPCFAPETPGRKSFNETDLTLSYTHSLGRFGLTAGFIYYGTKYTAETQELYVGAILDLPGKPTLLIYRDIGAYPGTYFLLSLAHSVALNKWMILDLGASAAYFSGSGDYWRTYLPSAGSYAGEKYRAFHDGVIKAGLTFPLSKSLGLQAGTQLFFPLSAAARRTIDGHSYNINGPLASVLVFGTTLTFGF